MTEEKKPQMFYIWAEGYLVTGMEGRPAPATLLGRVIGTSFRDACMRLARRDKEFGRYFNQERLTHWGRQLFPTEQEARRSFG